MQTTLPPTKYSTKTSEWRSQVPCSVWAGHIKHKPGSVSLNNTASDKKTQERTTIEIPRPMLQCSEAKTTS